MQLRALSSTCGPISLPPWEGQALRPARTCHASHTHAGAQTNTLNNQSKRLITKKEKKKSPTVPLTAFEMRLNCAPLGLFMGKRNNLLNQAIENANIPAWLKGGIKLCTVKAD